MKLAEAYRTEWIFINEGLHSKTTFLLPDRKMLYDMHF